MTYRIVQAVSYPLIPQDTQTYEQLDAQRIVKVCNSDDDYVRECANADAVIISGMTPFKREVIMRLDRCRVIAVIGIGYQVDVKAATEKGICVVNVPDYCLEEVSDHAMALILACTRKITRLAEAVSRGQWDSFARPAIRNDIWPGMAKLRGSTLGLVGFGQIARCVVPKAQGFGMKVIAHSPHVSQDIAEDMDVTLCELNELVRVSDFVSLHCPLVDDNRHFINASLLAKMKPTAYLINTARGPLIDETALYDALVKGTLAGAGLDVIEKEPPDPSNPLLTLPQVIVTAHSAHYSDEAMAALKKRPDEAICELLSGKWPHGLVNNAVKEIYEFKWGK